MLIVARFLPENDLYGFVLVEFASQLNTRVLMNRTTRPNSFRETDLKAILDLHRVEEVVICGAMSHMCVDAGARAASDLGYKCVVVHDACATRDQEFEGKVVPAAQVHAAFMAALQFGYAKVVTTAEYLAATPNA